jgi:hypothetical protein
VWKSWEILKPGFVGELKEAAPELKRLSLLRLTASIATGSVYLAAKEINLDLPKNYKKNQEILFTYNRDDS